MPQLTRRKALQTIGLGAAWLVAQESAPGARAQPPVGPFTLPRLPYAYDALAPHIDARTMEIHLTRHHQAYVTGLNAAVQGQGALARQSVDQLLRNINEVPLALRQRVINHGGGHYNHSMFWTILGPGAGGEPTGVLRQALNSTFGDLARFKATFKQACLDRFGSGWGWLVKTAAGRLEIISAANQDCPLMSGNHPILGLDVWEHAYYLNYQNRRSDYVDAWWNVVNWTAVGQRFSA